MAHVRPDADGEQIAKDMCLHQSALADYGNVYAWEFENPSDTDAVALRRGEPQNGRIWPIASFRGDAAIIQVIQEISIQNRRLSGLIKQANSSDAVVQYREIQNATHVSGNIGTIFCHRNCHRTSENRAGLEGMTALSDCQKRQQNQTSQYARGRAGTATSGLQNRCSTTELMRASSVTARSQAAERARSSHKKAPHELCGA